MAQDTLHTETEGGDRMLMQRGHKPRALTPPLTGPWSFAYCNHLSTAHHLRELVQKWVPHCSKRNWRLWIHLCPFTDIIPCSVSSLMSITSFLNSSTVITECNTASFTHHLYVQRFWRTEYGNADAPVYLGLLFSSQLPWQNPGGRCLWPCLSHHGQQLPAQWHHGNREQLSRLSWAGWQRGRAQTQVKRTQFTV